MPFNEGMVALATYNDAVYQGMLTQATYTAAASGLFSPFPAMMRAFATLLRKSAVLLSIGPNGIPGYVVNPLYKAEAVYWDKGWSFIGHEGDKGGFLILAGEQAGEIHEFTERTHAGISADAGVGFEIGRVDIYGRDESSFTSNHFYGFRDKGWASGSFPLPYLPPVLITGSVTLASSVAFYDGATVVATSIGLGIGIGPSKYMGGWNQGIIDKKKN